MGILPGHAALIAKLGYGVLSFTSDKKRNYIALHGGLMEVLPGLVRVLADSAEWAENVDLERAQKSRDRATEKLDLVGLGDRVDHIPAELSGGQQQRVAIARALANDPSIVWADEPTGNLDSTNAGEIMELLKRLNKDQGQTFVLVTHSDEVGAMADRIVRMSDGVIVDDGNGNITASS